MQELKPESYRTIIYSLLLIIFLRPAGSVIKDIYVWLYIIAIAVIITIMALRIRHIEGGLRQRSKWVVLGSIVLFCILLFLTFMPVK